MSYNNVNVNVSGPIQPASTYKTVVLKGQVPFATQVTEPNTKYVIKHNFDLGGESVTIPEGCLLEFDGGAISNGTLVGQSTILIYNQPLNNILTATLEGTWRHESGVKADEEDITDLNGELKFKDKAYAPANYSGLGRKYLRKNMVNGVNTLTQSMMNASNTIYVIQYDFTLAENIIIPANCILEFDGGSLNNGTVIGNKTKLSKLAPYNIFNDCKITGFNLPYYDIRWFGAVPDGVTDCSTAFSRAIAASNDENNAESAAYVYVEGGTYLIANTVEYSLALRLCGNNSPNPVKASGVNILVGSGVTAFKAVAGDYAEYMARFTVWVKNLTVRGYGNGTFLDYGISGNPSRPGEIAYCNFYNMGDVLKFSPYDTRKTIYCNLHIHDINAIHNQRFLVAETNLGSESNEYTLDCCIEHSCIENNLSENPIYINNAWGNVTVRDVLLEAQNNAVYINMYRGHILIEDCYLERQTGDYSIYAKTNESEGFAGSITIQRLYGTSSEKEIRLSGGIVNYNSIPMKVVVERRNDCRLYNHSLEKRIKFLDFGEANSIEPKAVIYLADQFNGKFCYRSVPVNTSGQQQEVRLGSNSTVTVYASADVSVYPSVNNGIWTSEDYDASKAIYGVVYVKYISETATPHAISIQTGHSSQERLCNIGFGDFATSYSGVSEDIAPNTWLSYVFVINNGLDLSNLSRHLSIWCDCDIEISNVFIFEKPNYFIKAFRGSCDWKYRQGMDTCINMSVLDKDTGMRSILNTTLMWQTASIEDNETNITNTKTIILNKNIGNTANRPALGSRQEFKGWKYYDIDVDEFTIYNSSLPNKNWVSYDGVIAGTHRSGTFANKPNASNNRIKIGFAYFCTDRRTTEGNTDGIIIYHKGNDVWVDALGRVVS